LRYAAAKPPVVKTPILAILALGCAPVVIAAQTAGPSVDPLENIPPADAPCRIIQAVQPQFPSRMLKSGVTHGTARVLVHVNREGTPVDLLVTAYTHRSFADEALRAIGKWRFEPTRVGGEWLDTIVDLTFNYETTGVVLVQKFAPEPPPSSELVAGYEYQACSLHNLDRLPTPLSVVQPTYPQAWADQGIMGRVTVDFYIDETGKTRFASPAADAHPRLAGIAVAAVQQWRFVPPTSKGRRVLVHARQVFTFNQDGAAR
jgi:TonB family protein